MAFATTSPDIVQSIRQRWLLHHWNHLCGPAVAPPWNRLDAEQLARTAETLVFVDVVRSGGDIRYRLRFRGAQVTAIFGSGGIGGFVDEVLPASMRDLAMISYRQTVETGQPTFSVIETLDRDGRPVTIERLLLPFSRDGRTIDRILGSIEAITVHGPFDGHDLMVAPHKPPKFGPCASIHFG